MKYLRFILLLLFMSVSCFATETIKISALTDGSSSVTTGTWLVGTIVDTTYKFSASSLVGLYLGTLTNDKYCKYNSATSKIDCIYSSSGLGDDNTWTGTNTFSSSAVFSDAFITKVNAAGGSADALTLSGTLGIMDGADDIFRGIYLNYTNSNHTAGNVFAINIAGITGDADATESAIYIQEGWDSGILSYSPVHLKGPSDVGKLFLFDTGEADYIAADVTTTYTLTLPAAAVDSGWTTGLLGFGPDGVGTFVNVDDISGTIPISGDITDEQVACWETSETPGTNKLKSCGAKTTDNSTATHLLCKDDSGEIENCTLAGLAISGTTSPTITVEAVPANATVNAAGEMTIDTTTDQIRWYGTAQQQLSPKLTFSVVVPSVADTDDMLIMKAPYGMTITALDCIVSAATSATINIQECDSAGANCVDTATSDLACDTDGANTTTLNNATVDSGDWLKLDVASISGTPGTLTVTVTYTIVAD